MGLMSRVLDIDDPSAGSSLLKRALKLRKKIEQSGGSANRPGPTQSGREPAAAIQSAAPAVVILDDVKKKPFPLSWTVAA